MSVIKLSSVVRVALVSLLLSSATAQASVIVWSPTNDVVLRGDLDDATQAVGQGATLYWGPCDLTLPVQTQTVGAYDLVAGITGAFTVDMCDVEVVFDDPVRFYGTGGSGPFAFELDDQSFLLTPTAASAGAPGTVVAGSTSATSATILVTSL